MQSPKFSYKKMPKSTIQGFNGVQEQHFTLAKTLFFNLEIANILAMLLVSGSKLSRHNLEVYQRGEGTETTLNGLTLIGGEQLADTHSSMMLNHQHGTFNQVHKCIIDDKAHGIFNGKVFVPQTAQLRQSESTESEFIAIFPRKNRY